jgi:hypothetical protein
MLSVLNLIWHFAGIGTFCGMEGNGMGGGGGGDGNGDGNAPRAGDFLMTGIKKKRVFGRRSTAGSSVHRRSLFRRLKASSGYADQPLYSSRQEGSNKQDEFVCSDEDDEDEEEEVEDESGEFGYRLGWN